MFIIVSYDGDIVKIIIVCMFRCSYIEGWKQFWQCVEMLFMLIFLVVCEYEEIDNVVFLD